MGKVSSYPVTKTKLALLTAGEDNESDRQGVEARNTTLFGKSVDREDGKLMPQSKYLPWVWTPGSFMDQRLGGRCGETKRQFNSCKCLLKMASLRQEDVLVSFSYSHSW